MRRLVFLLPLLFITMASAVSADTPGTPEAVFEAANQAMNNGHYDEAAAGYRSLLDSGLENGALHGDLGQALFREGKLGEALFHFLLASRLKPRDPDIEANLSYLRGHVTDKIELQPQNLLVGMIQRIAQRMNRRENWIIFSFIWLLFWALAASRFFWKQDLLRWSFWVVGLVLIVMSVTLIQKEFFDHPIGVVISAEAKVYSGPGEINVLLFELHEGAEVSVLARKNTGWLSIELADGKRGWVAAKDVISEEAFSQ